MIYILISYIALVKENENGFFVSQFEKIKNNETSDTSEMHPENILDYSEVSPFFVGDSRTLGMASALEKSIGYIDYEAKAGSGFSYFKSLDSRIRSSGADCLIIGFGVNDLGNIEKYISYSNILGEDLNIPVFFLTVNPVDEEKAKRHGYYIKESDINAFNTALKAGANAYYIIDTNDYLSGIGFDTMDGLHYRDETYEDIYDFIMKYLLENKIYHE